MLDVPKRIRWQCLLRVTQNRVIQKADGTKGYLKAFARSLEPMALKTIAVVRSLRVTASNPYF